MLIYLLSENETTLTQMKSVLKSKAQRSMKIIRGAEGLLYAEQSNAPRYLMVPLDEYPGMERYWMPVHVPLDADFEDVVYDPADGRQAVGMVREMIDFGYMRKAAAKEYAHRVNMSETYLCRLFKSETGHSIGSYIFSERMERAASILRETDLMVRDVAESVGYPNFSYFCKRFKKYFGITPNAYRYSHRVLKDEVTDADE